MSCRDLSIEGFLLVFLCLLQGNAYVWRFGSGVLAASKLGGKDSLLGMAFLKASHGLKTLLLN